MNTQNQANVSRGTVLPSEGEIAYMVKNWQKTKGIVEFLIGAQLGKEGNLVAWSQACDEFETKHGMSWMDAISFDMQEDAYEKREQDQYDGYDACDEENGNDFMEEENDRFQSLTIEEINHLESYIQKHPFQMVSRETYSSIFKIACASRRSGVPYQTWGKRVQNQPGFIAWVIIRVWSMPITELVGR